jgi:chemotaxis protein CheC
MDIIEFNDEQKEYLQELMNISYGKGTAAIADTIESFATMEIPKIEIFNANILKDYLISQEDIEQRCYLATQVLNGDIIGENLFIMNQNSAQKLADVFKIKTNLTQNVLSGIVLEITNILSATTIGKLAEELGTEVYFEPPLIKIVESTTEIDKDYFSNYNQVIVISTKLKFEEQHIAGKLMLLITNESVLWIRKALDKLIEEYS